MPTKSKTAAIEDLFIGNLADDLVPIRDPIPEVQSEEVFSKRRTPNLKPTGEKKYVPRAKDVLESEDDDADEMGYADGAFSSALE